MNYWPDGMKVQPIVEWPGVLTHDRVRSNFSSTQSATLQVLRRELAQLGAKDVLLQIAIPREAFRLDGFPRSTAKPSHPGLILTLDSKFGPLSYPCDTFTRWEDNLRAIALALEALRKVDRYGVTKRGEQYRGFLAIEATAMPAGFTSVMQAKTYIADLIAAAEWTTVLGDTTMQIRQAKRLTHPDMGGDSEVFQRVVLAEKFLQENGGL